MKIHYSVLLFAFLFSANPAFATDTNWRSVTGKDLYRTFAKHELSDDVHFTYQFKSDGTISGYGLISNVKGKWRTKATQICWTWIKPVGAEECYEVLKWRNDVRLFKNHTESEGGILRAIKAGQ